MTFWKMLVSLLLCANLVASVLATGCPKSSGQCELVEESQCARHFNYTFFGMFPSRDLSMSQAVFEFGAFLPLLELNNYCSHVLHSFLCFHYFPHCVKPDTSAFLPCREVCEVAWSECLDITYQMLSIPPPEHLNCTNFPSKNMCNTICPDPADHFDFCLPLGTNHYAVVENDTTLEVCVKLFSTNSSNNTLMSPVQIALTTSDINTTAGHDYIPVSTTIEYQAGSTKGTKQCVNISILDDLLIEGQKAFIIHAMANSSSDIKFGGALQSSHGAIEVNILDNDDCVMPQRYCGDECNQRLTATRSTLTNNDYTYAAHIQLLGKINFEECTAINVHIISCQDLGSAHVCEPANTTITIPTCANCPTLEVQVGEEYLIAGLHRKIKGVRRMVLPSSRREGLFAEWDSDRHSNLFE